jgi:hypothetical protein
MPGGKHNPTLAGRAARTRDASGLPLASDPGSPPAGVAAENHSRVADPAPIIGGMFRYAVPVTPAAVGVTAAASTQALAVALAGQRR